MNVSEGLSVTYPSLYLLLSFTLTQQSKKLIFFLFSVHHSGSYQPKEQVSQLIVCSPFVRSTSCLDWASIVRPSSGTEPLISGILYNHQVNGGKIKITVGFPFGVEFYCEGKLTSHIWF